MCSTYTLGDMNSTISPAESTIPDDSKTLLLYLTLLLDLELWASEVGHYLEISSNNAGRVESCMVSICK